MLEAELEELNKRLNAAQDELIDAETSLLEVQARAQSARESVQRLKAAVAALSGESPPPAAPESKAEQGATADSKPADEGSSPSQPANSDLIEDVDEWEAARKKKLREQEKARIEQERANNPLYDIKCTGCGQSGFLQQSVIQAPSGSPLQCIVCSSCGNQTFG